MNVQKQSKSRFMVVVGIAILVIGLTVMAFSQQLVLASGPGSSSLVEASQGFADAFAEKDPVKIGSYFAQDAVAMYPLDTVPLIGAEANTETWVQAFQIIEAHPITSDLTVEANSKDVGYSYGRWAVKNYPELGDVAGRYVATWEWTKSGWKITLLSAHIHEDVPPSDLLGK